MFKFNKMTLSLVGALVLSLAFVCALPPPPQPMPAPETDASPNADQDDMMGGEEDEFIMMDQDGNEIDTEESELAAEIMAYSDERTYCDSLIVGKPDPGDDSYTITQEDVDACYEDLDEWKEEIMEDSESVFEKPTKPTSTTPKPQSGGWLSSIL